MAQRVVLLLSLLVAFTVPPDVWGSNSREYKLRQFNAGQDAYYAPAGGRNSASSSQSQSCGRLSANAVENAETRCTNNGCRVKCKKGFRMNSRKSLFLTCDSSTGEMTYLGQPWSTSLPTCAPYCGKKGCPELYQCTAPNQCEAKVTLEVCPEGLTGPNCQEFVCDPPCQNGGTCIFVGVCECPLGYWGLLCETHRCVVPDQHPAHSFVGVDNDITRMDIGCENGYQMKSQSTFETFTCNHGQWIIPNKGQIDDMDVNCYAA